MYDTLLDYDPQGNIVANLAQKWAPGPSGLSYTFTLQGNVDWYRFYAKPQRQSACSPA